MLEAFNFIAQIIAAVAIIASLIFVGQQLRAQTQEQKIRRVQERVTFSGTFNDWIVAEPLARRLASFSKANLNELNDEEFTVFAAMMRQVLLLLQLIHVQEDTSDIGAMTRSRIGVISRTLTTPQFQDWWQHYRMDYDDDFADFVDRLGEWGKARGATNYPGRGTAFETGEPKDDT